MIPFVHTFWSCPQVGDAVQTKPGAGWQFPQGAFSSPVLTLPDWYGPWPRINQAYWRSECAIDYLAGAPSIVGVQLVAMTYDISSPQVLCELRYACEPKKVHSQPYNRNVTAALAPVFAAAVPARDNALQLGVRVMSEAPALVFSSRLFISFAP